MPLELTFLSAVVVGLLGSTHCLGMCGGIVAALNLGTGVETPGKRKSLFGYNLLYNFGRIISYGLVGLVAGSLGSELLHANPAAGRLLAAAFMVALGLYLANWWRGLAVLEKFGQKLWRRIQPLSQRLLPVRNPGQAFLLGLLWGWLPCGLVYAVVAWALTAGSAIEGALLMLGFGIGTLPAMLVAGNALQVFGSWVRSPRVRAAAGLSIIAFGVYSGISALSPRHLHDHVALSAPAALTSPIFGATLAPAILRRVS
jgi:sulfite exporter TauE/SafE